MALISIQEAAQRIGATEDLIRQWISKGLLEQRLVIPKRSTSNNRLLCSLTLPEVVRVDEEELYEVAEMYGWLLLSAYSLDEEGNPSDSSA
ncbi:MAG: hypothetical protein QXQ53_08750 [Candidatus Methanosuratincola sp.]